MPRKVAYAGDDTGLTVRQRAVAAAILTFKAGNGTCPASITDVANIVGKDRGPTRNVIQMLVDRGYFEVVSTGSPTLGPTRYKPTARMGV